MRAIKILIFILCVLLPSSGLSLPAYGVSPSEKTICNAVGKVVKSGKNNLICAATHSGKYWIKTMSISNNLNVAKKQSKRIMAVLNNKDLTIVQDYLDRGSVYVSALDNQVGKLKNLEEALVVDTADKLKLEGEVRNLQSDASQVLTLVNQSSTELNAIKKTYDDLNSRLNVMSAEFSVAYNAKTSYITCRVLRDFGYIGSNCGSYNSYYDVVISRYNALEAQVTSAFANYDSYYKTYLGHYQKYKSLLDSQNAINPKVNAVNQKISSSQSEIAATKIVLKELEVEVKSYNVFLDRKDYYLSEPRSLSDQIANVVSNKSKDWKKKLSQIYLKYQIYEFNLDTLE